MTSINTVSIPVEGEERGRLILDKNPKFLKRILVTDSDYIDVEGFPFL